MGTTCTPPARCWAASSPRNPTCRPTSSPPIISPCFYGIDTTTKKELIGSTHSIEEIRKYITADSLAYLSLEGLLAAAPGDSDRYCNACFTENYPIPFTKAEEMQLGLFDRP